MIPSDPGLFLFFMFLSAFMHSTFVICPSQLFLSKLSVYELSRHYKMSVLLPVYYRDFYKKVQSLKVFLFGLNFINFKSRDKFCFRPFLF